MNSILEALEKAQDRNKQRDAMNQQRYVPLPTLPIIPTGDIQPMNIVMGGGGGNPPVNEDTRTEQEKYNDAVKSNREGFGGVSSIVGVLNDMYISNYEKTHPLDDPVAKEFRDRFSKFGQVLGGLGWPEYTTLGDRFMGREPTWAESLARINYDVPIQRDWSQGGRVTDRWGDSDAGQQQRDGTTSYGGRESAVGQEDRSGYA